MEFGYKAQVADNHDGVILDYSVECGAAPDGPQLAPAVERIHRRAGRERRVAAGRDGRLAIRQAACLWPLVWPRTGATARRSGTGFAK